MAKVYVYLWFDIEDYITEESHELPITAFRILSKYNVPVTCKIVAEKVRALKARGRDDVIQAISEHDVGYHLDTHSRHPTMYEYLSNLNVQAGAKEFLTREAEGFSFVKQVFGTAPSCFGHPGPTWAPHTYPALQELGIQLYLDETPILNLKNEPYWYCGLLNLNGANNNFIVFDFEFERPQAIQALKKKFRGVYKRLQRDRKSGFVSILFHLHTAINQKFWDEVNFGSGKNPSKEEYVRPPPQPREVTLRAWSDFEELIRYIKQFKNVEFITARDALKICGETGPRILNAAQLKLVSKHYSSSTDYWRKGSMCLSPAEAFYAIVKALSCQSAGQSNEVEVKSLLGPMESFRSKDRGVVQVREFLIAAQNALEHMDEEKHLPSMIKISACALSPESFLVTASRLLNRTLLGKKMPTTIVISAANPPNLKYVDDFSFRKACKWKVLPPKFKAPRILEQIKLQAWTLKPAIIRSEMA